MVMAGWCGPASVGEEVGGGGQLVMDRHSFLPRITRQRVARPQAYEGEGAATPLSDVPVVRADRVGPIADRVAGSRNAGSRNSQAVPSVAEAMTLTRSASPCSTSFRAQQPDRVPVPSRHPCASPSSPTGSASPGTGSPSTTTCRPSPAATPPVLIAAAARATSRSASARAASCCQTTRRSSSPSSSRRWRRWHRAHRPRHRPRSRQRPGHHPTPPRLGADRRRRPVPRPRRRHPEPALPSGASLRASRAGAKYAIARHPAPRPRCRRSWLLLGSSDYSAKLAGRARPRAYVFANHFSGEGLERALGLYRTEYRPSEAHPSPETFLTVNATVAPTAEEARARARCRSCWSMARLRSNRPMRPLETIEEAASAPAGLDRRLALHRRDAAAVDHRGCRRRCRRAAAPRRAATASTRSWSRRSPGRLRALGRRMPRPAASRRSSCSRAGTFSAEIGARAVTCRSRHAGRGLYRTRAAGGPWKCPGHLPGASGFAGSPPAAIRPRGRASAGRHPTRGTSSPAASSSRGGLGRRSGRGRPRRPTRTGR